MNVSFRNQINFRDHKRAKVREDGVLCAISSDREAGRFVGQSDRFHGCRPRLVTLLEIDCRRAIFFVFPSLE